MYEIEFYEDKNGKSAIADFIKELNTKAATNKECRINFNQRPRCKQRGIKLATLQSSGVFDPRGVRQMRVQAPALGSLLAEIK